MSVKYDDKSLFRPTVVAAVGASITGVAAWYHGLSTVGVNQFQPREHPAAPLSQGMGKARLIEAQIESAIESAFSVTLGHDRLNPWDLIQNSHDERSEALANAVGIATPQGHIRISRSTAFAIFQEHYDTGADPETCADMVALVIAPTLIHERFHVENQRRLQNLVGKRIFMNCLEEEILAYGEGALYNFERIMDGGLSLDYVDSLKSSAQSSSCDLLEDDIALTAALLRGPDEFSREIAARTKLENAGSLRHLSTLSAAERSLRRSPTSIEDLAFAETVRSTRMALSGIGEGAQIRTFYRTQLDDLWRRLEEVKSKHRHILGDERFDELVHRIQSTRASVNG